jgi:dTDP-L-rhamnose 4-epimerase
MTAYGEGLYRRPSDGRLLRSAIRTEDDIARAGWEPACPETGEPLEPVPTPEDAALTAQNVYALTKRWQEDLVRAVGIAHGLATTCLRLFNVYGPRQTLGNPYTGVLAIFLTRLLASEPPIVYEDGRQTRDFVSVHDVTDAVLAAVVSDAPGHDVMNVGSGVGRSIGDVARTLGALLGRPDVAPRITGEFRRGDVRHCVADTRRARERIDFVPRVAWEDGLEELVAWARGARTADRFADADHELRAHGLVSAPRPPR